MSLRPLPTDPFPIATDAAGPRRCAAACPECVQNAFLRPAAPTESPNHALLALRPPLPHAGNDLQSPSANQIHPAPSQAAPSLKIRGNCRKANLLLDILSGFLHFDAKVREGRATAGAGAGFPGCATTKEEAMKTLTFRVLLGMVMGLCLVAGATWGACVGDEEVAGEWI